MTERERVAEIDIMLREVRETDLLHFYEMQRDPVAVHMAAFTAADPDDLTAFMKHWTSILANDAIHKRTVEYRGEIAGQLGRFEMFGEPSIGYWIKRELWGRGIATHALRRFLLEIPERPLFARVVADNLGSINVLTLNGFVQAGEEIDFADSRKAEVTELIFRLD